MIPMLTFAAAIVSWSMVGHVHGTAASHKQFVAPIVARKPNSSIYPDYYSWVKVKYQGQSIITVGNRKLPVPIRLPSYLTPVGNEALMEYYSEPTKFGFNVYFTPDKEAQVRKWISQFPNSFLLSESSYDRHPLRIHTYSAHGTWASGLSVSGKFGAAHFTFGQEDLREEWWAIVKYSADNDDFQQNARKLVQALTLPNSPLSSHPRVVRMHVVFHLRK